jgi:uncharacterized OB-fold protein
MTRRIATKKTLFTVPPTPDRPPALLGGRCCCGHVFFPPQRFGCDVCGAHGDRIQIVELAASGVLKAFAVAHRQRRADGTSPPVVGSVILDEGPAVEVMLDTEDDSGLFAGQRVHGRLVETGRDDEGRSLVDCRFTPEGGA